MKIIGIFKNHNIKEIAKKDGSGTFLAGDAIFEIDNSYEMRGGEVKEKHDTVPFNCFGTLAQSVVGMHVGSKWEIQFELEGREAVNKNGENVCYPRIKAFGMREVMAMSGVMPQTSGPQVEEDPFP